MLDNNIILFVIFYLVVWFYEILDIFNYVVFDFFWGYFVSGFDFLDVMCFIYKKNEFFNLVDYKCCRLSGINYFGDVMDNFKWIGYYIIYVYLK